jgi:hypothetical protein
MTLDFTGVGGCDGKECGWLAVKAGLAWRNPALPIGAIVRAMVARLRVPSWRCGGSAATISSCNHITIRNVI